MKDLFLKDIENNKQITWESLIKDLHTATSYNPYCKSADYYTVFYNIILSLVIGEEIILLDSDFTDSELINLTGHSNYSAFDKQIEKKQLPVFKHKQELIEKLNNPTGNWKVTLFTSGTTGFPKRVSHDFQSIVRFVKLSEKHKTSVWGFAYNPTHMAGIQVFFQALLNGNTMIRLFGLKTEEIHQEIEENNVTHLSATPSFYRLLLPCDRVFKSVTRVTFGGEKFNGSMFKNLNKLFPNAKITNVYASTEAGTLLASQNDIFTIRPEFVHLIRIENEELVIHTSLIGTTDSKTGEWYHTGDIVELVSEEPLNLRIVNRKNDMINVGGYKVNPHEVEEALLTFPGVLNARVYPKANSVLGNIICCEIITENREITEFSIRTFLQSKLQEFKIPRIIRFVEELSTTRTGKIKRN